MTLNELKYIVAVARERHFGRAARACFVSQPTLSVAVKKLEEQLGIILFERAPNQVMPTPVGRQIVAQAQLVLEAAREVRRIAQGNADPLLEPLRVGVIYTIGPYLLPHLIPVLRERVPAMPIIVEEGFTADLRVQLKQGGLDAIILSSPFSEPGVASVAVYHEPFVVVLPRAHPLAQLDAVHSEALADETVLLLGHGHCFRDQVLEECPSCRGSGAQADLQKSLEGGSIETIRHMVAGGVGVTVLPCTAAGAEEYSRRLLAVRRFADKTPTREVIIAWRKGYPRLAAVEALRQAICACPMSCARMLERNRVPAAAEESPATAAGVN
ncbi:MAG: hydrogen peroxide-inducible genes activator [Gammaproteobacteria bacterium]|nr:hydrogen peroxide-inducible genes activator [Gammaproteobacteria bacterium]MDD9884522.1 hydrogen peroxide-inducible genes activator [Gammaproteobacteria bacterium]